VTSEHIGARVPVIKQFGAHALELGSLWDLRDKHAFPIVLLRQRLWLLTLPCGKSCLQPFRLGKLLGRKIRCLFLEDNQAVCKVIKLEGP
jgi:hypothetical protein